MPGKHIFGYEYSSKVYRRYRETETHQTADQRKIMQQTATCLIKQAEIPSANLVDLEHGEQISVGGAKMVLR